MSNAPLKGFLNKKLFVHHFVDSNAVPGGLE